MICVEEDNELSGIFLFSRPNGLGDEHVAGIIGVVGTVDWKVGGTVSGGGVLGRGGVPTGPMVGGVLGGGGV